MAEKRGYLTIKGYQPDLDNYILGFPNEEVYKGFGYLRDRQTAMSRIVLS